MLSISGCDIIIAVVSPHTQNNVRQNRRLLCAFAHAIKKKKNKQSKAFVAARLSCNTGYIQQFCVPICKLTLPHLPST